MIRITDKKNRERLTVFLYFFYLCPNTKNTHKIMKKLFILFTLLLQLLSPIYPQQAATVITPSLKYGKPSKEELLFTTYTPDTTATALSVPPGAEQLYLPRWFSTDNRTLDTHKNPEATGNGIRRCFCPVLCPYG